MSEKAIFFIKERIEAGEEFALAQVVGTEGSTPRKAGAFLAMAGDGSRAGTVGGGRVEAEVEKLCLQMLKSGERTILKHYILDTEGKDALDMGCGGEADVQIDVMTPAEGTAFLEELEAGERVVIFGGGHVALALEPVLRHVGFRTVVIDDREEFANRDRYPEAYRVEAVPSYKDAFSGIKTDEETYIIIVTRGHLGDYDVLRQAVALPRKYLGMIGSRKKTATLFDMLRAEGVAEETINRIYAPIGEPIFAETPEEIAISITGELIRVRNGHGKHGE